MSSFSERFGYQPIAVDLKDDEMPAALRNGLWDAVTAEFFPPYDSRQDSRQRERDRVKVRSNAQATWWGFYREPADTIPDLHTDTIAAVRKKYFAEPFYRVYDFIEFLARRPQDGIFVTGNLLQRFVARCNVVLERERSPFRFARDTLVRVSDQESLREIEQSVAQSVAQGVQLHIRRAAELFSARPAPDYRNSIKESISAVEAAVAFVTGGRPDGVSRPLRKVFDQYPVHPALRDGFEKLYAYTSDAGGIRHALLEESDLTQEDARYMLVVCSAFANYLLATYARRLSSQQA